MSDPVPPAPAVPPAEKPRRSFKRRLLKWLVVTLGTVVGAVILLVGAFALRGRAAMNRTYEVAATLTNIPTDPASIARGAHIARTRACMECHGEGLRGQIFLDIPPALAVASNLTRGRGGGGSTYSPADWDRAVRHGVRPDGSPLIPFMPYRLFNRLNDADMAALASYLAALPAVDNQLPPSRLKLLGYIIIGSAGLGRDELSGEQPIITPAPTREYGSYLASTTCVECHGERLEGGKHPDPDGKPGPGLHGYAAIDVGILARTLRTGVAADGRQLTQWMPWQRYSEMDDTEIGALHAYLRSLATP